MINVLSVDDQPMNHKVVSLDIEDFMDEKGFDYQFYTADDGLEAIKQVKAHKPKVIFMDMMMPYITGAETIRCIRCLDDVDNPIIIMVTALGDEKIKTLAKEAGANGFISKPFKYEAVDALLTHYLKLESEDNYKDGEIFFDFDFDEEFADGSFDDALGKIENFNESHKTVSAEKFLKEYSKLEISSILDDIEDLTHEIIDIISVLYEGNLSEQQEYIIHSLELFKNFVNNFELFQELEETLEILIGHISVDYEDFDEHSRYKIAEFIKAILTDLLNWKRYVFTEKTAKDVFYINASILTNSIQLEKIMKK